MEVLTPDFLGVEEEALATVLAARPEVFNHNIETVRRLHRRMRGAKASYDKALWLLRRAKELAAYPVLTKSGIIVGLGETNDEVVETMTDLRAHGVDVVTIGQYLQPSSRHAPIDRWVHPDEFRWFREQGEAMGFGSVFSGPLVRSSYRADEQRHAAETGRGALRTSGRQDGGSRPDDGSSHAALPPTVDREVARGEPLMPCNEISPRDVPVRVGTRESMSLRDGCQEPRAAPSCGSRARRRASPRRSRPRGRPRGASDRRKPPPSRSRSPGRSRCAG